PTCTQPGELIVIPHLRPHRLLRGMTHGGIVAIAGSLVFLATGMASRALADTFYVDGPNPAASDANPGTAALPYRTILGAVKARCAAGNTVVVKPGIYREQVSLPGSGGPGNPFVIQAQRPGVVVDG